jgi:hypothetical protein
MSITSRMLPLNGSNQTGSIGAGAGSPVLRAYSATAGGFVDALGDPSGDAASLTSQGFVLVGASGTTTQRPTGAGFLRPGFLYVDTTASLVVIWDGASWRNPVSGAVA